VGTTACGEVVEAAAALAPLVRSQLDEIEGGGRLPEPIVEAMNEARLFQLYCPAEAGGPEADPLSVFRVTEHLARADGSVAWCSSISTALSSYLGWLSPDGLAEVMGPDQRVRLAGSARPLGTAVPAPDGSGYHVQGHWDFASNVLHADYYVGTCILSDGRVRDDGAIRTRAVFVPVGEGRVEPTWDALGMRGTGSHDFVVDELFVPQDRVTSMRYIKQRPAMVYRDRLTAVAIWSPTAGVALGLARGALDDFAELATGGSTASPTALRLRREVQLAVGEAEAVLGAARAYVVATVSAAWDAVCRGAAEEELDRPIAQARLAITHAMGEAVRCIDGLLRVAGTNGLFVRAGIERRFRDAYVASHHAAGLPSHTEAAGRVLLGLPAGVPYF
jgi:alkylation response protein AidB-like acyl-CoA dehydrogenase